MTQEEDLRRLFLGQRSTLVEATRRVRERYPGIADDAVFALLHKLAREGWVVLVQE